MINSSNEQQSIKSIASSQDELALKLILSTRFNKVHHTIIIIIMFVTLFAGISAHNRFFPKDDKNSTDSTLSIVSLVAFTVFPLLLGGFFADRVSSKNLLRCPKCKIKYNDAKFLKIVTDCKCYKCGLILTDNPQM